MWPEELLTDEVPAEESDEARLRQSITDFPRDKNWCIDQWYGYDFWYFQFNADIAWNGCDWSVYDYFKQDINYECAWTTYYFPNFHNGNFDFPAPESKKWWLRGDCPWTAHERIETTTFEEALDEIMNEAEGEERL